MGRILGPPRSRIGKAVLASFIVPALLLSAGLPLLFEVSSQFVPIRPPEHASVRGVSDSILIEYDEHGIAKITAGSFADALAGLGYVHASLRPRQIRTMRDLTETNWFAGPGMDPGLWLRGNDTAVERGVAGLDDESRVLLDAYREGLAGAGVSMDLRELFRTMFFVLENQSAGGGSNAWFVSRGETVLMAADPHQSTARDYPGSFLPVVLEFPAPAAEAAGTAGDDGTGSTAAPRTDPADASLTAAGTAPPAPEIVTVFGMSLPGTPFITHACGTRLSWAMTSTSFSALERLEFGGSVSGDGYGIIDAGESLLLTRYRNRSDLWVDEHGRRYRLYDADRQRFFRVDRVFQDELALRLPRMAGLPALVSARDAARLVAGVASLEFYWLFGDSSGTLLMQAGIAPPWYESGSEPPGAEYGASGWMRNTNDIPDFIDLPYWVRPELSPSSSNRARHLDALYRGAADPGLDDFAVWQADSSDPIDETLRAVWTAAVDELASIPGFAGSLPVFAGKSGLDTGEAGMAAAPDPGYADSFVYGIAYGFVHTLGRAALPPSHEDPSIEPDALVRVLLDPDTYPALAYLTGLNGYPRADSNPATEPVRANLAPAESVPSSSPSGFSGLESLSPYAVLTLRHAAASSLMYLDPVGARAPARIEPRYTVLSNAASRVIGLIFPTSLPVWGTTPWALNAGNIVWTHSAEPYQAAAFHMLGEIGPNSEVRLSMPWGPGERAGDPAAQTFRSAWQDGRYLTYRLDERWPAVSRTTLEPAGN